MWFAGLIINFCRLLPGVLSVIWCLGKPLRTIWRILRSSFWMFFCFCFPWPAQFVIFWTHFKHFGMRWKSQTKPKCDANWNFPVSAVKWMIDILCCQGCYWLVILQTHIFFVVKSCFYAKSPDCMMAHACNSSPSYYSLLNYSSQNTSISLHFWICEYIAYVIWCCLRWLNCWRTF